MPLLTVFSAPKPFTDPHIAVIQRNAIQSWLRLGPQVEVLLVGDEPGLAEVAAEYGVRVLPQVERNASGTPLVSSIFALARETSQSAMLSYVNADILLMSELVEAATQIASALENRRPAQPAEAPSPFLLIGQRWDLELTERMSFSPDWEARLQERVLLHGRRHPPAGSDYFVFPRSAFNEMPEFAIGRAGWDNWMIYHARQQGWPVIDGTPSLLVVHQNHDYSHLPGGKPHYDLEESQQNMALAGGLAHMYMVLDADFQLRDGRLQRPPITPLRAARRLERWLMPADGSLRGRRGGLARKARRLRRRLAGEL